MITDKFIFIDIPFSGSEAVKNLIYYTRYKLKMCIDSINSLDDCKEFLEANGMEKLPSFCVVRNPWEWYVSRFIHAHKELFEKENTKYEFIRQFDLDQEGFTKHLYLLQHNMLSDINLGEDIPFAWGRPNLNQFHLDLSYEINYAFKLTHLANSMIDFFNKYSIDIYTPREIRKHIRNIYQKDFVIPDYHKYYNNDTRFLVREWDSEYINTFGFSFGGEF